MTWGTFRWGHREIPCCLHIFFITVVQMLRRRAASEIGRWKCAVKSSRVTFGPDIDAASSKGRWSRKIDWNSSKGNGWPRGWTSERMSVAHTGILEPEITRGLQTESTFRANSQIGLATSWSMCYASTALGDIYIASSTIMIIFFRDKTCIGGSESRMYWERNLANFPNPPQPRQMAWKNGLDPAKWIVEMDCNRYEQTAKRHVGTDASKRQRKGESFTRLHVSSESWDFGYAQPLKEGTFPKQ